MANVHKHLVYSIHTPAIQAWKETPESSQEKNPRGQTQWSSVQNRLIFKAEKSVKTNLTRFTCHFSCQSYCSCTPPPQRLKYSEAFLELKTCFLWLSLTQRWRDSTRWKPSGIALKNQARATWLRCCVSLSGARASRPDLRENQILVGFSPEQPQLSTD